MPNPLILISKMINRQITSSAKTKPNNYKKISNPALTKTKLRNVIANQKPNSKNMRTQLPRSYIVYRLYPAVGLGHKQK